MRTLGLLTITVFRLKLFNLTIDVELVDLIHITSALLKQFLLLLDEFDKINRQLKAWDLFFSVWQTLNLKSYFRKST